MDDVIGRQILEHVNMVAQQTNGLYDEVNSRVATEGTVRARIAVMRSHLEHIETQLVYNTILASVK